MVVVAFLGTLWVVGLKRADEAERTPVRQALAAASSSPRVGEAKAELPSPASVPAPHPDGAVEVCGLGWVAKPVDEAGAQALTSRLKLVEPR